MSSKSCRVAGQTQRPAGESLPRVFCLGCFATVDFATVDFGTVDFGTVDFGTVDFGTVDFGTVGFGTVDFGTVDFGTVGFGTVGFGTVGFSTAEVETVEVGCVLLRRPGRHARPQTEKTPKRPSARPLSGSLSDTCDCTVSRALGCAAAAGPFDRMIGLEVMTGREPADWTTNAVGPHNRKGRCPATQRFALPVIHGWLPGLTGGL